MTLLWAKKKCCALTLSCFLSLLPTPLPTPTQYTDPPSRKVLPCGYKNVFKQHIRPTFLYSSRSLQVAALKRITHYLSLSLSYSHSHSLSWLVLTHALGIVVWGFLWNSLLVETFICAVASFLFVLYGLYSDEISDKAKAKQIRKKTSVIFCCCYFRARSFVKFELPVSLAVSIHYIYIHIYKKKPCAWKAQIEKRSSSRNRNRNRQQSNLKLTSSTIEIEEQEIY